ncbi:MAG: ATP-binding protein [Candidatus Omnitrophica bacterium CG07_land_8_20_14_0_80_50_8]|nr:MAG: ATP-binding protein [Candidatus Omnitrophica bacterium CG07_land_8_20_14_0_80_50_8]
MSQENIFTLYEKLPTNLKQINPFLDRVFDQLAAHIKDAEQLFKVKLALEEALTNAMRHGNGLKASRKVTVRIAWGDGQIHLDVSDEGKGFNPRTVPDPTQIGYAENIPGGRGIFLMQKMMDRVEFYDGGRGIRMVKKIL